MNMKKKTLSCLIFVYADLYSLPCRRKNCG